MIVKIDRIGDLDELPEHLTESREQKNCSLETCSCKKKSHTKKLVRNK